MDVALVTGAGRGIGLAIARLLARDGMSVAVADLAFEDAPAEVPATRWVETPMDVRDEASVERGFAAVESHLGPVRVLVANAGVLHTAPDNSRLPVWDLPLADWEDTFAVNARATFTYTTIAPSHLTQATLNLNSSVNSTGTTDPVPANNSASYSVNIVAP